MNCQIEEVIRHSPDWNPKVYDPASVLSGTAETRKCDKPAVAVGKIGEYLCADHANNYPGKVQYMVKSAQGVMTNAQAPFLDKHHAQTVARFRLVEDEDCHWYVIPFDQEDNFNEWVRATAYDEETPFNFDNHRLSGSPSNMTFTDPILEESFKS